MIGLVFLYFVGKYFFDLAGQFKKKKWLYAILGVISFYAGLIMAGIAIGILSEFDVTSSIETIPEILINIIVLPFGILTCWLYYQTLKNNWSKKKNINTEDVLDSDFL